MAFWFGRKSAPDAKRLVPAWLGQVDAGWRIGLLHPRGMAVHRTDRGSPGARANQRADNVVAEWSMGNRHCPGPGGAHRRRGDAARAAAAHRRTRRRGRRRHRMPISGCLAPQCSSLSWADCLDLAHSAAFPQNGGNYAAFGQQAPDL